MPWITQLFSHVHCRLLNLPKMMVLGKNSPEKHFWQFRPLFWHNTHNCSCLALTPQLWRQCILLLHMQNNYWWHILILLAATSYIQGTLFNYLTQFGFFQAFNTDWLLTNSSLIWHCPLCVWLLTSYRGTHFIFCADFTPYTTKHPNIYLPGIRQTKDNFRWRDLSMRDFSQVSLLCFVIFWAKYMIISELISETHTWNFNLKNTPCPRLIKTIMFRLTWAQESSHSM